MGNVKNKRIQKIMNVNEKVSVIVPVYNIEGYLDRCIQSVLHQTYTNIELVLIDDGSTDSSGAICDSYAKTDSRVLVFHQKNAGVCAARNRGIESSTGDYITFVDGDDWIEADSLEKILKWRANQDLDMIVARSYVNDGKSKGKENYRFDNSYVGNVYDGLSVAIDKRYMRGSACGVVYSKCFLISNQVLFPSTLKNGEDSIFSHLSLIYAKKVGFADVHFYNVFEREGSASRSWTFDRVYYMIENVKFLNTLTEKNHIYSIRAQHILDYSIYSAVSYMYNKLFHCFTLKNFSTLTYALKPHLNHKLDIGDISIFKKKVRILNTSLFLFGITIQIKNYIQSIIN